MSELEDVVHEQMEFIEDMQSNLKETEIDLETAEKYIKSLQSEVQRYEVKVEGNWLFDY